MCVNNCGACSSCSENFITIPVGPQGPQGIPGPQGVPGNDGIQGATGLQGLYGGYSMEFNFNTFAGFPAASGRLQINNADWTLSNIVYVNHIDINGEDSSAFLNSFVNDGNYGYIKIFKSEDSSIFLLGKVTNVVTSGSYTAVTYTYISSNGTPGVDIINDDNIVLSFTGNGATGVDSEVIVNDTDQDTTTSLSPTVLKQNTIPAGLLSTEDVYVIEGTIGFVGDGDFKLAINSTDLFPFVKIKAGNNVRFKVELNVANNTNTLVVVNVWGVNGLDLVYNHYHRVTPEIVNNLSTLPNDFNVIVQSNSGGFIVSPHLVTYKFKK